MTAARAALWEESPAGRSSFLFARAREATGSGGTGAGVACAGKLGPSDSARVEAGVGFEVELMI